MYFFSVGKGRIFRGKDRASEQPCYTFVQNVHTWWQTWNIFSLFMNTLIFKRKTF